MLPLGSVIFKDVGSWHFLIPGTKSSVSDASFLGTFEQRAGSPDSRGTGLLQTDLLACFLPLVQLDKGFFYFFFK